MNRIPPLTYMFLLPLCLLLSSDCYAQKARLLSEKGWQELAKDNDTTALRYFSQAYLEAKKENNQEYQALALLQMGICYYSVSYSQGMQYALLAMDGYKKLERTAPDKALEGRSKCLQLISTINSRQGKYREAIALSREAAQGFPAADTTGYLGLIYNSLGVCYQKLGFGDSSEYYHRLALRERLSKKDLLYLPGSYLAMADIATSQGNRQLSLDYHLAAQHIADSTGNRQAQVSALLGLGKWHSVFEKDASKAETEYLRALDIARTLTDKSFYLRTLDRLSELKKQAGDYSQALAYREEMQALDDTLRSWDKQKALQILEVQFDVAEKDRRLQLAQKEQQVRRLSSYLLAGSLLVLLAGAAGIIIFLRRINRRDRQLLLAKESLMGAMEEQKRLKEQQMQHEIEFRESQLSSMTLQMLQKNELLQEIREKLDQEKPGARDQSIHKIINTELDQAKEWTDFDRHFESINKNFYNRLKQDYPDISPNDLKICALIKMNLSIKEMAAILNISPDSVKTARYRLRKKLQLNTEDNLTDFILSL